MFWVEYFRAGKKPHTPAPAPTRPAGRGAGRRGSPDGSSRPLVLERTRPKPAPERAGPDRAPRPQLVDRPGCGHRRGNRGRGGGRRRRGARPTGTPAARAAAYLPGDPLGPGAQGGAGKERAAVCKHAGPTLLLRLGGSKEIRAVKPQGPLRFPARSRLRGAETSGCKQKFFPVTLN